jgi:hypothetical protein
MEYNRTNKVSQCFSPFKILYRPIKPLDVPAPHKRVAVGICFVLHTTDLTLINDWIQINLINDLANFLDRMVLMYHLTRRWR